MKYGKLLTRARRLSNPTWQACWLDYHDLKGMIYTITGKKKKKNGFSSEDEELSSAVETTTVKDQHSSAAAKSSSSSNDGGGGGGGSSNRNSNTSDTTTATSQHSSSQRQQHSQQQPQQHQHHQQHNNNSSTDSGAVSTVVVVVNPASVPLPVEQDEKSAVSTEQSRAFFERLRQELRKVSNFYNTQESILLNRTAQFAQELTAAELQHIDEKDAEEKETRVITLSRLMESCKVLYVDLMMLENFAVMNYGGFAKILKKHDKNTSFITQERYLRKVVNVKPFALYEQLKKAISLSEQAFTRLVNMIPSDIDNGSDGSDGSDGEHSRTGPTVQSTFLSSESSSSVLSGRTERTGRSNSGSSPKRNFSSNELSTLTSLREIAEAGQKISPSVSPSIIRAQSPAAKVTASMGAIAASTAAKRKHIIHEASHVVETNSDNNKKRKVEQ
jgi:hypothetical protein